MKDALTYAAAQCAFLVTTVAAPSWIQTRARRRLDPAAADRLERLDSRSYAIGMAWVGLPSLAFAVLILPFTQISLQTAAQVWCVPLLGLTAGVLAHQARQIRSLGGSRAYVQIWTGCQAARTAGLVAGSVLLSLWMYS